ncbi:uncharacterized protein BDR25DRAFT_353400 [Lindgomyces ingoldianus]|uniref:Uncharacterized protein n=1 Tax=Lindgomyces ingoldianus TaxID=673940 RepID=A0ACB6QZE0_9PLEO|nr:uncharacterized protein BDR25DRAFT_353400 [Lindgomyces ingoldianus]KAF2472363.1 hypothetical protein BDR25DRAFT_353400 [Lindgomyces ingoldianus]
MLGAFDWGLVMFTKSKLDICESIVNPELCDKGYGRSGGGCCAEAGWRPLGAQLMSSAAPVTAQPQSSGVFRNSTSTALPPALHPRQTNQGLPEYPMVLEAQATFPVHPKGGQPDNATNHTQLQMFAYPAIGSPQSHRMQHARPIEQEAESTAKLNTSSTDASLTDFSYLQLQHRVEDLEMSWSRVSLLRCAVTAPATKWLFLGRLRNSSQVPSSPRILHLLICVRETSILLQASVSFERSVIGVLTNSQTATETSWLPFDLSFAASPLSITSHDCDPSNATELSLLGARRWKSDPRERNVSPSPKPRNPHSVLGCFRRCQRESQSGSAKKTTLADHHNTSTEITVLLTDLLTGDRYVGSALPVQPYGTSQIPALNLHRFPIRPSNHDAEPADTLLCGKLESDAELLGSFQDACMKTAPIFRYCKFHYLVAGRGNEGSCAKSGEHIENSFARLHRLSLILAENVTWHLNFRLRLQPTAVSEATLTLSSAYLDIFPSRYLPICLIYFLSHPPFGGELFPGIFTEVWKRSWSKLVTRPQDMNAGPNTRNRYREHQYIDVATLRQNLASNHARVSLFSPITSSMKPKRLKIRHPRKYDADLIEAAQGAVKPVPAVTHDSIKRDLIPSAFKPYQLAMSKFVAVGTSNEPQGTFIKAPLVSCIKSYLKWLVRNSGVLDEKIAETTISNDLCALKRAIKLHIEHWYTKADSINLRLFLSLHSLREGPASTSLNFSSNAMSTRTIILTFDFNSIPYFSRTRIWEIYLVISWNQKHGDGVMKRIANIAEEMRNKVKPAPLFLQYADADVPSDCFSLHLTWPMGKTLLENREAFLIIARSPHLVIFKHALNMNLTAKLLARPSRPHFAYPIKGLDEYMSPYLVFALVSLQKRTKVKWCITEKKWFTYALGMTVTSSLNGRVPGSYFPHVDAHISPKRYISACGTVAAIPLQATKSCQLMSPLNMISLAHGQSQRSVIFATSTRARSCLSVSGLYTFNGIPGIWRTSVDS